MYVLLFVFWFLLMFCMYYSFKFRNPYKLIMVFGKKGSGKTTFLTKTAVKAMRKGKTVYSTVEIPGVILYDVQNIGVYTFPHDSVILIDEVGMIWDNRNYKNFRMDVRDYFKLQRQYRNTVYLFSQTFDVDVKLRNLTDSMYLCKCYFGFLSIARRVKRDIVIVSPQGDSEARIADNLELEPLFLSLLGLKSAIFTFIPNWVKYFKSYNPKPLPMMPGTECPPLPRKKQTKKRMPGIRNFVSCRKRKHIITDSKEK